MANTREDLPEMLFDDLDIGDVICIVTDFGRFTPVQFAGFDRSETNGDVVHSVVLIDQGEWVYMPTKLVNRVLKIQKALGRPPVAEAACDEGELGG